MSDITQRVAGTHLWWPDASVCARVPEEPGQEQSAVTRAPWEGWQQLHAGPLHIRSLSLTQERPTLSEEPAPVRPALPTPVMDGCPSSR